MIDCTVLMYSTIYLDLINYLLPVKKFLKSDCFFKFSNSIKGKCFLGKILKSRFFEVKSIKSRFYCMESGLYRMMSSIL